MQIFGKAYLDHEVPDLCLCHAGQVNQTFAQFAIPRISSDLWCFRLRVGGARAGALPRAGLRRWLFGKLQSLHDAATIANSAAFRHKGPHFAQRVSVLEPKRL